MNASAHRLPIIDLTISTSGAHVAQLSGLCFASHDEKDRDIAGEAQGMDVLVPWIFGEPHVTANMKNDSERK